ncbi:TetR/AcrR family transcriptional regulator [Lysobacter sp. 1R34A]|uniref:TetR/AcrR family transcriptional regulator n=1 Tax=Lysobacter sp. 1R34A TaxID=3445786 RepID=UPI003EEC11EA
MKPAAAGQSSPAQAQAPAPAAKPSASSPPAAPKRAAGRPAANKRAPGRPAAADNPDLRARLLDAAIACYARHGIAATSLRAIAGEAGVNPALLHYYFGDKEQLQEAVSNERLLPVFMSLRENLTREAGGDVMDLIAGFVHGIGRVIAEHPWLPSLWVREVLCEGGALRESLLLQKIGPLVPQMMARRFAEAQQRGQINAELDPRLLMVSLIGLTLFPAASAPIWRRLFDADDLDLDSQRRHALALLDRGLTP